MAVNIPIDAHILSLIVFNKPQPSSWNFNYVKQVIGATSEYWNRKAGLCFSMNSCTMEKPVKLPGDAAYVDEGLFNFIKLKYKSQNGRVSLMLVNRFKESFIYRLSDEANVVCSIIYSNLVTEACKALCHELGHLLNLPDNEFVRNTIKMQNLMYEGIYGMEIDAAQIDMARSSTLAKKFGAYGLNCPLK